MSIPPEVRVCWDQETIDQVELALESLPEDLHPAVWYLGAIIADARVSLLAGPVFDAVDEEFLVDFGLDPEEVAAGAIDVYVSIRERLDNAIAMIDALTRREYEVVCTFFQEKLRIFISTVSAVAATADDMTDTVSFVERRQVELFTLRAIVALLLDYTSDAKTPPH